MKRSTTLLLGLLAFVILCVLCVSCHKPRIEADLTARASEALGAGGFDGIEIDFDGRTGILTLPEPLEARSQAAIETVEAVRGVRNARVRLLEPSSSMPAAPSLDRDSTYSSLRRDQVLGGIPGRRALTKATDHPHRDFRSILEQACI